MSTTSPHHPRPESAPARVSSIEPSPWGRWIGLAVCVWGIGSVLHATLATHAWASEPAGSVGLGEGRVTEYPGEGGCGDLFLNADGTYENGYSWQYGGIVAPEFGAFAECYPTIGLVCAAVFDLTQVGNAAGHRMDVFVWEDQAGLPSVVSCAVTDVDPGAIAFWPSLSRHTVEIPPCNPGPEMWVGYWGAWPNELSGWYVGADLDGLGGCPLTNIAPGIGYPTGWRNVSIVWGPTQALGIGALFTSGSVEGACCYADGSCLLQLFADCGGRFQGIETTCDPNPCPQPGACCFADGSCLVLLEDVCNLAGGEYLGDDLACDPNPCPQPAACCFATGDCLVLLPEACSQQDGTYLPNEPSCDPNPCEQPSPGACCYPGGYCVLATIFDCEGGAFLGNDTSCEPNPCDVPEFGACCYDDGGCRFRLESACEGWFQGVGTSCEPNPCPPLADGACCFQNGACAFLTQFDCVLASGNFLQEESCDPNPCPQPLLGACCLDDGECLSVDETSCVAARGEFQGYDTSCQPNPCPLPMPGACCLTLGSCEVSDDVTCAGAGGVFQGVDTTCEPNPCPQPCEPFTLAGRERTTRPAPPLDPFEDRSSMLGTEGWNRGGTLVLHSDPSVTYSQEGLGVGCDPGGVGSCDDIVARTDLEDPVILYAIALFPLSSTPHLFGLAFGIDYPDCVQLLEWETCGDFEITDGSWPAPGSGTAMTWTEPQTELSVPVYRFLAQGLAAEPGEFALAAHPTQGAVFADDHVPSILDPITGLGSFGFFRDGVTPCPGAQEPLGACCFEDESCEVHTFPACEDAGGVFVGVNLPCDPDPCTTGTRGACCFPSDGSCLEVTESVCLAGGGVYQGDDTDCVPNPCGLGPIGACCFGNGSCFVASWNDCVASGGYWAGNSTDCDPDPCPPTGACCLDSGICTIVFASYCGQIGGEFLGEDSECDGGLCPSPGACCFPNGDCAVLHAIPCEGADGSYQGDATVCDPNPCPQPPDGACCFPDGSCAFVDTFECDELGGSSFQEGEPCVPNPCPQPPDGACCLVDGSCLFIDSFECDDAGGQFLADDTCEPNPCPFPEIGACCLDDGSCVVLADYQCDEQSGRFLGDGAVCEGALCGVPCVPPGVHYDPPDPGRGPNANGTLIMHTNPSVVFTTDELYCGTAGITECSQAIAETDRQFEAAVVHVVAAFPPSANPRLAGVTFGISYADCLVLEAWGPCGDFELPTPDWPVSGEGTAVTWGTAQTSLLTEVYWIAAYVYSVDPTTLDLIPHPTQGALFADDDVPSILDPIVALGSFGFGTAGSLPCPMDVVPGACCFEDGSCEVLPLDDCNRNGGAYQGDGTRCDPNPCSQPPGGGACCFPDGTCIVTTEADCPGIYMGDDTVCDPNPCPNPAGGACCVDVTCTILSALECDHVGGVYLGDGVPCDPNPCGATPTIESSWGRIKERFRP